MTEDILNKEEFEALKNIHEESVTMICPDHPIMGQLLDKNCFNTSIIWVDEKKTVADYGAIGITISTKGMELLNRGYKDHG